MNLKSMDVLNNVENKLKGNRGQRIGAPDAIAKIHNVNEKQINMLHYIQPV